MEEEKNFQEKENIDNDTNSQTEKEKYSLENDWKFVSIVYFGKILNKIN